MADVELNSIGNGDGTNYLVRDNTKIPLSGSNQISGDLVPSTNGTVNLGGSQYQWNNAYIKLLTINGAAVITENIFEKTDDASFISLRGGNGWSHGAAIVCYGKDSTDYKGSVYLHPSTASVSEAMLIYPGGTWTWTGQAVQLISDQRLKQQISKIDNALLDAWEDVELSQFKYNDAVDQKKDKARLHTGYVVQQIDEACKSHGVDVSKYGLYCHEEYAEETREVEHEDGTKTTEVVRPASEHYSLRYTEALIVECAYLRKKNKDLQEQLNALSERLEKLENR